MNTEIWLLLYSNWLIIIVALVVAILIVKILFYINSIYVEYRDYLKFDWNNRSKKSKIILLLFLLFSPVIIFITFLFANQRSPSSYMPYRPIETAMVMPQSYQARSYQVSSKTQENKIMLKNDEISYLLYSNDTMPNYFKDFYYFGRYNNSIPHGVTRDEILKDYSKLQNTDDLFDSDILILSFNNESEVKEILQEIKRDNADLNVKYYTEHQTITKCQPELDTPEKKVIDSIIMVISTVSGLITLIDFLNRRNKKNNITIETYYKYEINYYIYDKLLNPYLKEKIPKPDFDDKDETKENDK